MEYDDIIRVRAHLAAADQLLTTSGTEDWHHDVACELTRMGNLFNDDRLAILGGKFTVENALATNAQ